MYEYDLKTVKTVVMLAYCLLHRHLLPSILPLPSFCQSVFKDFKEVKQHGSGTFKERPHSGGPGGRLMGIDRRTNTISFH